MFQGSVCFPEPAQGNRAVPVDGSVLSLTGILSVIRGDAIHSFTCPAFLWRESTVLWARGECSEGAELHFSRSGVGHGDPGAQEAHLLCSLEFLKCAGETL